MGPGHLTCTFCGDVIGVYEPIVVLTDDEERMTSLAREPELRQQSKTPMFHARCLQHHLAA